MKITSNWPGMGMKKLEDGTLPPQTWWLEKGHPQLLVLLQLSTQSENQIPNTDYYKKF